MAARSCDRSTYVGQLRTTDQRQSHVNPSFFGQNSQRNRTPLPEGSRCSNGGYLPSTRSRLAQSREQEYRRDRKVKIRLRKPCGNLHQDDKFVFSKGNASPNGARFQDEARCVVSATPPPADDASVNMDGTAAPNQEEPSTITEPPSNLDRLRVKYNQRLKPTKRKKMIPRSGVPITVRTRVRTLSGEFVSTYKQVEMRASRARKTPLKLSEHGDPIMPKHRTHTLTQELLKRCGAEDMYRINMAMMARWNQRRSSRRRTRRSRSHSPERTRRLRSQSPDRPTVPKITLRLTPQEVEDYRAETHERPRAPLADPMRVEVNYDEILARVGLLSSQLSTTSVTTSAKGASTEGDKESMGAM